MKRRRMGAVALHCRPRESGIPTVLIDLEDQEAMVKQEALVNGMPNVRYVHASRTMQGPDDVDRMIDPILDGLLRPLTDKEKEGGVSTLHRTGSSSKGPMMRLRSSTTRPATLPGPSMRRSQCIPMDCPSASHGRASQRDAQGHQPPTR